MGTRRRHPSLEDSLPAVVRQRMAALVPAFPDVSVCVAFSGGVDSVALLAALVEVRATHGRRMRLRAVHVHHGLHPNADRWSEHCAEIAARLRVPLRTVKVNVARGRGVSIEAAAREARYSALAKELARSEVLVTAHHEDDQFETVLLQLLRGAGVPGLAAMPEIAPFGAGWLVRPLLMQSRAQIEAWARSRGLAWVDDDTNANEQFDRNYLRQRVLPLIRARWPGAAAAAARSARHVAEAKRLLDALARADVERAAIGSALSVQRLRALDPPRRRNAVRFWIARAGHSLPDTRRLDEITQTLLNARPDANPQVDWNGSRVQRHADELTLQSVPRRAARSTAAGTSASAAGTERFSASARGRERAGAATVGADGATPNEWHWRERSRFELGDGRGILTIEPDPHGPVDLDALPAVLLVRGRAGGEALRPHPKRPTKTVKSLLQEARVPLAERDRLPLLFSGARLVAVADRWLDASVQPTASTRKRGRIRWQVAN
ncbi:MAG: tRNA lysidine(34) synthetase TilS [Steroidobacteraceae bacterium]|nr:tRNA lysidine(34) synthetase TilS [Steroidobacteraceae bacterium]